MKYYIDLAVRLDDTAFGSNQRWEEINTRLEQAVPNSESAGTGFGLRDMQWLFDNYPEAVQAMTKLLSTGLQFAYISLAEYEEE